MSTALKSRLWRLVLVGVIAGAVIFVSGCSKDALTTDPDAADKDGEPAVHQATIDILPSIEIAPWTLQGLKRWKDVQYTGVGPTTMVVDCGEWMIIWGSVEEYRDPVPKTENTFLKQDMHVVLEGVYTPNFDIIGIYTDMVGDNACALGGGVFQAYLVLTGLTRESISGWECKITHEGGVMWLDTLLHGDGVMNVAYRENEYVVGMANPLPAVDRTVVVATFTLYAPDEFTADRWFISPCYFPSVDENLPCYADGLDSRILMPLTPSSIYCENPVFEINTDCGASVAE